MTDDCNTGSKAVISSYETSLHKIEAQAGNLVLYRKFPPTKRFIVYSEIASVEHARLIDYGRLINVAIPIILLLLINYVSIAKGIVEQLVREIGTASNMFAANAPKEVVAFHAEGAISFLSALFVVLAGYYMIRFTLSLSMRFIVYRTGKNPIAIPMKLTGEAMEVLASVNTKVKEARGISKEEAEKIVGGQIRDMLAERTKMQEDLISSVKVAAMAAKTDKQKARVKKLLDDSIAKIEAQDEVIDRELKKTGLKKDELFTKYRIKAPKDEFIESVLNDGDIGDMLKDK